MAKFALALVQARYGQLDDLKRRAANRAEKSVETESPSAILAKQKILSYLLEETSRQVVRKVFVVPHLIEYSALTKIPESGWFPFLFSAKSLEKDFA